MNKAAFTLLELITAMSISSILIILGIFGVLQLQKSSRDQERGYILTKIAREVDRYKRTYLVYPTQGEIILSSNGLTIKSEQVLELERFLKPANSTNSAGTKYYLNIDTNDSKLNLCAILESGKIDRYQKSECPSNTASW